MSNILEVLNQFVIEEDQLVNRIQTCDKISATILDILYRQGNTLNALIIEEILISIHRIHQDLQTELLHLRIEKKALAFRHDSVTDLETA